MKNSQSQAAPSVRTDVAVLPQPSANRPHEVDAIPPVPSRLMQEVLPWMTSLAVHVALIALGIATATVIMAPPKPPFVEQVAPADGKLHEEAIDPRGLANAKMPSFETPTQDNDPDAANGLAQFKGGNKMELDAGGGEGAGAKSDGLIGGPNQFRIGRGGGIGTGDGTGDGNGEGGLPARFGTPQIGGPPGMFTVREAKRIVFICDSTGTMIQKIGTLKHELTKAIANLKPYQSFNIIFFTDGGKYHIADKNGLIVANPDNKRQAYAFLEDITPNGTTDPTPAIAAAFKQNADLVYFLSDGEFNNLKPYEEVVRQFEVSNKEPKCRVNAILFETYDRDAEQAMQKIAQVHGGTYRYVREADLQ